MTLKIDRETLVCTPEQFATAVDQHIAALTEYNEHLKGVEEDAADPSIPHENKRVAFPPPYSPIGNIEMAIGGREDGSLFADYEIVGPSLEVRKQRLAQRVSETEQAELAKVTPPGKARYWQMREQAILRADSERWNKHVAKLNADAANTPGATVDPGSFTDFVTSTRSDEDSRLLEEQEARRRKEEAIHFWAAKQHHDIEDLTEETVDSWQMEVFGG